MNKMQVNFTRFALFFVISAISRLHGAQMQQLLSRFDADLQTLSTRVGGVIALPEPANDLEAEQQLYDVLVALQKKTGNAELYDAVYVLPFVAEEDKEPYFILGAIDRQDPAQPQLFHRLFSSFGIEAIYYDQDNNHQSPFYQKPSPFKTAARGFQDKAITPRTLNYDASIIEKKLKKPKQTRVFVIDAQTEGKKRTVIVLFLLKFAPKDITLFAPLFYDLVKRNRPAMGYFPIALGQVSRQDILYARYVAEPGATKTTSVSVAGYEIQADGKLGKYQLPLELEEQFWPQRDCLSKWIQRADEGERTNYVNVCE